MTWWMYALLSAVAASMTTILAKVGVVDVPANLATAIRVVVVVVVAWAFVFAAGEHQAIPSLKGRAVLFLVLSGVGTGASWLCWFQALKMAPASRVAPIDKLSLALTLILAVVVLHEALTWKVAVGTALVIVGALLAASG